MNAVVFRDRENAARELAAELRQSSYQDPLVLGIPRGGVVTAAVLARELHADCDVVLVRKLRAPAQPELAIGAVSENGEVSLSAEAQAVPDVTNEYIDQERQRRLEELSHRRDLFRSVRPAAPIAGRSVIVTDDGIATGSTMLAALDILRKQNPHELIVAVPVAPPSRLEEIRAHCDRVVCLATPESFMAISQFYENFDQVQDDEVQHILTEFAAEASSDKPAQS